MLAYLRMQGLDFGSSSRELREGGLVSREG